MPSLPKWLANGMEKVFNGMMQPVEVAQTKYYHSHLKWVQFSGELSDTKFDAGNVIEFRISDTDFRHYTPSHYDKAKGVCEVLFYLHGYGPGSIWADRLEAGDQMKLMGPGGKMAYQFEQQRHFCFGDESSLGLCLNIQSEAKKQGNAFKCLLELDAENQSWPEMIALEAELMGKSHEYAAQEALDYIEAWPQTSWAEWQEASFYLTGRAKSIQRLRKSLLNKGVSRKQIISSPYWAEGKKGL
ncbi:MAG: siderophore-interacting protein [Bacteroidota bacterium]